MNVITFIFSFLPVELQVIILTFVAFLALLLVFKLVKIVLDAIPLL